jgi:hypothetical protein
MRRTIDLDPLDDAPLGRGRGGRARALAPAERPWVDADWLGDGHARGSGPAGAGAAEQDRGILRPSLADGVYAVDLRALALTLGDFS